MRINPTSFSPVASTLEEMKTNGILLKLLVQYFASFFPEARCLKTLRELRVEILSVSKLM